MYYQKAIEKTVAYIEEHLKVEFSLNDLVYINGFSRCHFSRLFHLFTGYTLSDYIKKRRLTEAAKQLIFSDQRILDIALEFQFSSQESFTRSFSQLFGMTPGKYRSSKEEGNFVRVLDIKKIIWMNGGLEMKPKIVVLEDLKVMGMVYKGKNQNGEIGQLWNEFIPKMGDIKQAVGDHKSYGICEPLEENLEDVDFDNPNDFRYLAGLAVHDKDPVPEGMEVWDVTHKKYAVFTHIGSVETLGDTYKAIYSEWIPSSGYQVAFTYDFELYDDAFKPGDSSSKMYIYIPIK